MILLLLFNKRPMIQINTTSTISFYKIKQVARIFPLVQSNVKFNTIERIHNRSAKLIKLETAFNRLCEILRHPKVLQEIIKHKFMVWRKKRSIDGQTLIKMMGIISFNDALQINTKSLQRGNNIMIKTIMETIHNFTITTFDMDTHKCQL
ncbi:unnamed protein product [Adineta steineri]|uniref:Uncharacterized protein n=1 Tax=Adineta steineri TaxID=433720 RepID=A0A819KXI4_9BILA|nr:unnamed protein product [Adineta steineri]CAF3956573.1 unnamed protein product [Adineta steineri]